MRRSSRSLTPSATCSTWWSQTQTGQTARRQQLEGSALLRAHLYACLQDCLPVGLSARQTVQSPNTRFFMRQQPNAACQRHPLTWSHNGRRRFTAYPLSAIRHGWSQWAIWSTVASVRLSGIGRLGLLLHQTPSHFLTSLWALLGPRCFSPPRLR
jgi:hypothetical protein